MTEHDLFRALSGLDPDLILQAEDNQKAVSISKTFFKTVGALAACFLVLVLLLNIPNLIGYHSDDPNADPVVSSIRIDCGEETVTYWKKSAVRPIFDVIGEIESTLAPLPVTAEPVAGAYRITVSLYDGGESVYWLTETTLIDQSENTAYSLTEEQYRNLKELLEGKEP